MTYPTEEKEVKECAFCNHIPKTHTIGRDEKTVMVKCVNSECAIWGYVTYLYKWNRRPTASKIVWPLKVQGMSESPREYSVMQAMAWGRGANWMHDKFMKIIEENGL